MKTITFREIGEPSAADPLQSDIDKVRKLRGTHETAAYDLAAQKIYEAGTTAFAIGMTYQIALSAFAATFKRMEEIDGKGE